MEKTSQTPDREKKRVLLFGDSLTAGNYFPEHARHHHWASILGRHWANEVKFINEGKGGRPSDCLQEFEAALAAHPAPDLLVLWLGTNDSREMDANIAMRTTQNLRCMIHRARALYGPELSVLLVAPPNIHPLAYTQFTLEFAEARQANLRAICGAIDELATGEQCASVNLFGTLPPASLAGDGVHPDAEGNLAMARVLAPALAQILEISALSLEQSLTHMKQILLSVICSVHFVCAVEPSTKPNILWLIAEDMSPHFGCYGEKAIETPHVDKLAAGGVLFERAFVTAPICSTSRSALITGMYQTSIGAHHHRSGLGIKIELPDGVRPLPRIFQQAGYHTSNASYPAMGKGKTDYNFEYDEGIYDGTDWKTRKPGQPFFAQIQLIGGKTRDIPKQLGTARKQLGSNTPAEDLPLPPYYPRTPAILNDWAATLDAVRITDHQVGEIMERLRKEGILDQTIIFFITDHGVSHGRGKQFLYDEGTHIAFAASGPGLPKGERRNDLIEHIDMAAMSLSLAGISLPEKMQARNVLAPDYQPREATYSARDRADETMDHIRSVRTERWKYIRNFLPQRPYLQPNDYKDHKPCLIALRAAEAAGELDDVQRLLFAKNRPPEELYDLDADPWEVKNLAADPAHAATLLEIRSKLDRWMEQTNDQGRTPETEARYDAEMAVYQGLRPKSEVTKNIALMKQWAKEGK